MSLRDMVSGSDMCTPSDGAGPSNAMGSLVNTLLGGAGKTQEQLRELPTMHPGLRGPHGARLPPDAASLAMASGSGLHIPGVGPSTMDQQSVDAFLRGINQQAGPSTEWDQIFNGQMPAGPIMGPMPPQFALPPGPAAGALAPHFQAFLGGGRGQAQHAAGPLPPELAAQLSVADKCRIRDRSTILARHVYADMGDRFADQQVHQLLASLQINPAELPAEMPHIHDQAWHDVWNANQHMPQPSVAADMAAGAQAHGWDNIWNQRTGPQRPVSTGWASEFAQQHAAAAPAHSAAWGEEFAQQHPTEAWANEFTQDTAAASASGRQHETSSGEAMASTRALVDVLSRDADPKMRNSKFLQFISKMSKGELMFEDNKVVERSPQAAAWSTEFEGQQRQQQGGWADEFSAQQHKWAEEFNQVQVPGGPMTDWADEFAKGVADINISDGAEGINNWADEFAQGDEATYEEWEKLYGQGQVHESFGSNEYVFARNNPFLGDLNALQKGKDLFRRGVLTEAALALEAEVQAHPENAEAWRLLGTVHAENDDDRQAIAAMSRAHRADPRDMAVLLALGVSHTNELDQTEALSYLRSWLGHHPDYAAIEQAAGAPPDSSQRVSHVIRMFEAAIRQSPSNAELYMALGVLHHLSRQYQGAVSSFEKALQLRPQDYSLWNKLGATLANNARSSEAIAAYQKALDLKPNYMRAWTNMGISFANVGDYDKSARFYVQALGLNPKASHVWGYLRTSLACAGKLHLMPAVDQMDLASLSKELPMV